MAIRPIIKRGDPSLQRVCQPVTQINADVLQVVQDLRDTLAHCQSLYDFTRGSGIAAPQIGESWAISVVIFDGIEYVLINPEIKEHSRQKRLVPEGCLSFFTVRGQASRWSSLTVEAMNEHGHKYTIITADANLASLLQHEIDHLAGLLYLDRMPEGEHLYSKPGAPEMP